MSTLYLEVWQIWSKLDPYLILANFHRKKAITVGIMTKLNRRATFKIYFEVPESKQIKFEICKSIIQI